jgi:hypothetical protein
MPAVSAEFCLVTHGEVFSKRNTTTLIYFETAARFVETTMPDGIFHGFIANVSWNNFTKPVVRYKLPIQTTFVSQLKSCTYEITACEKRI